MQRIRGKTLNTGFEILWRLAILALPWQTRWFADAQLAGWPWEQGRLSFYGSWILLIAVIALGSMYAKRQISKQTSIASLMLLAVFSMLTVLSAWGSVRPAAQWWTQVLILAAFFVTLWRADISLRKIVFWFVVSLIPAALIGIIQFFMQSVWAFSWLGMSAQNPVDLGVSVVQAGGLRLLRAYGTFPHPNIFGGFMAIGAICATWLSIQRPSLGVREGVPMSIGAGELGLAGLFTFSLFLSFSRSAWIGFVVALIVIAILNLKNWRRLLAPMLICIAVFGVSTFVYRDFVISRSGIVESRTEQISNASRIQSYALGLEIYKLHPLAGSGPNNELAVYASAKQIIKSPAPLEPPHSFWLMLLDDFGLIGSLFMLTAICFVIITIYKRRKKLDRETLALAFSVSVCWFVVSILDHYVWSLWPGQVLTALTVTLAAITISSPDLAD